MGRNRERRQAWWSKKVEQPWPGLAMDVYLTYPCSKQEQWVQLSSGQFCYWITVSYHILRSIFMGKTGGGTCVPATIYCWYRLFMLVQLERDRTDDDFSQWPPGMYFQSLPESFNATLILTATQPIYNSIHPGYIEHPHPRYIMPVKRSLARTGAGDLQLPTLVTTASD